MDRKPPILPAAVLAVSAAVLAVLTGCRDDVIINSGIRAYNAIRLAAGMLTTASAAWTVVSARRYARAKKQKEQDERDARWESLELRKKSLDEDARRRLYHELVDFSAKKWSGMAGISKLLAQLDSMDEYQSEMGRLLDQTDYLKQKPAEIVQKVEDCMYVNIRKLLNYMRIIQTRDPETMRAKIAECEEKNAGLLRKTDDFVVAVVAYVNGDIAVGEEEKARTSVDEYMYVVLQAIDLPETRLG